MWKSWYLRLNSFMAKKKYDHILIEDVIKEYVEDLYSTIQLAEKYNVSEWWIADRLKKAGVKIRNRGGGVHMVDISGERFGYYTVINKLEKENNNRGAIWQVVCDCGNVREVLSYHLRSGESKSCGDCLEHHNWKGVGEMSGNDFANIRRGAEKRNMIFDISKEYVWDLYLKQDKKCALTGLDIRFVRGYENHRKAAKTASLDRINSKLGYVKGNVQWIHKVVNIMKWHLDEDYFIEMCRKVVEYNESEISIN